MKHFAERHSYTHANTHTCTHTSFAATQKSSETTSVSQIDNGQLHLHGSPEGAVYLTHWGPEASGWGSVVASGSASRISLSHVVADAGGKGTAFCAGGLYGRSAVVCTVCFFFADCNTNAHYAARE